MRTWDGEKFKKRLKEILAQRNLNQEELAEVSGISSAKISQWKNADHNNTPRIDHIGRVADALNCNTDWLAFGEGPIDKQNQALFDAVAGRPHVATLLAELAKMPAVFASSSQPPADSFLLSAFPRLSDSEVAATLAFAVRGQMKGFGEDADYEVCVRLATLLAEEADARKLAGRLVPTAKSEGIGGKDQPIAASVQQPASPLSK